MSASSSTRTGRGELKAPAPLARLLSYQRKWLSDDAAVKVCEKSRRIGITWTEAADDVMQASLGSDVWYTGYNLDMAKEYIEECAEWARAIARSASAPAETLIADEERDIQAYQIRFANGRKITALSSSPRNLRGKQGIAVIDEAAFHQNLPQLLKAALAFLMWGGRVRIISTHDGANNAFNQLLAECRGGARPYSVHRYTLDDALADGLYKTICAQQSLKWSPSAERAWREEIFAEYGDGADEELLCVPRGGAGAFFSSALVESRSVEGIPVARLALPDLFAELGEAERVAQVARWIDSELGATLAQLRATAAGLTAPKVAGDGAMRGLLAAGIDDSALPGAPRSRDTWYSLGIDFARDGDLTVMWAIARSGRRLRTPIVVELRNVPFRQQDQVMFALGDAMMPRLGAVHIDARGAGRAIADSAQGRWGSRVRAVTMPASWYSEAFPRVRRSMEDGELELPRDREVAADLRLIEVIDGVPRVPETKRTRAADKTKRHGDAAVALALACDAAAARVEQPMVYRTPSPGAEASARATPDDDADDRAAARGRRAWRENRPPRAAGHGAWSGF